MIDETEVQYAYSVYIFQDDLLDGINGWDQVEEAMATAIGIVSRNVQGRFGPEHRVVYHHIDHGTDDNGNERYTITGYTLLNEGDDLPSWADLRAAADREAADYSDPPDETEVQYGFRVTMPSAWADENDHVGDDDLIDLDIDIAAAAKRVVRANVYRWLDGEHRVVYHHFDYAKHTVTAYTLHNERAWMKR